MSSEPKHSTDKEVAPRASYQQPEEIIVAGDTIYGWEPGDEMPSMTGGVRTGPRAKWNGKEWVYLPGPE